MTATSPAPPEAAPPRSGRVGRAEPPPPPPPGRRRWSGPSISRDSVRRAAASIRLRIVVGYFLLMAAGLTVAIVISRQVQAARIDSDIDMTLTSKVDQLRRLASGDNPATGEPYGRDVRALFDEYRQQNVAGNREAFYTIPLDERGQVDESTIRRSFGAPRELIEDPERVALWASVTERTKQQLGTEIGNIRALAVPVLAPAEASSSDDAYPVVAGGNQRAGPDQEVLGVFVAVRFTDANTTQLNQLTWLLAFAGLGVLAVTTAMAWWLAGRIIAPVRQLTTTAKAITHSNLSARIPVVGRSELAELGTTFNEMIDRLENGFRAQRQFLDDVAHDLRTPITIARGHLEVLGDDPAERDETVSIVLEELDRMGRAVRDLLVLAKSEQPDFLRLQPVDFGDLAADLCHRVSALADRAWTLDAAPRPGMVVGLADADRLIQAVLNLAANAVEHTGEGDEIGLGVAVVAPGARLSPEPAVTVELWVRDHGPGIDVAEASVLFERYGRGRDDRTASDGDGMGLGLSIVDAIARAHGGIASHSPTPGGGATFSIVVPVAPPDREE